MVWAGSTQVGCGVKTCADGWTYVVCRYLPAGNDISSNYDRYPRNVYRTTCQARPGWASSRPVAGMLWHLPAMSLQLAVVQAQTTLTWLLPTVPALQNATLDDGCAACTGSTCSACYCSTLAGL